MNSKTKSGFTLIELLVVIAIIGILASVTISSLNKARARAQAAKIVSTFKAVEMALIMTGDELGWSKWPENVGAVAKTSYTYDPDNPTIPLYLDSAVFASLSDDLPGFSNNFLVNSVSDLSLSYGNILYRCAATAHQGVPFLQIARHHTSQPVEISEYVDGLIDDGLANSGKIRWNNGSNSSHLTYLMLDSGFSKCSSVSSSF